MKVWGKIFIISLFVSPLVYPSDCSDQDDYEECLKSRSSNYNNTDSTDSTDSTATSTTKSSTETMTDEEHVAAQKAGLPCNFTAAEMALDEKVRVRSKRACSMVFGTNITGIAGLKAKDMKGVSDLTKVTNSTQTQIDQIIAEGQKEQSLTEFQFDATDIMTKNKIDYAKWRRDWVVGIGSNMTGFMMAWHSDYLPNLRSEMIKRIEFYATTAGEQIMALQSLNSDLQNNAFDKARFQEAMLATDTTTTDCTLYPAHADCLEESPNLTPSIGKSGGYVPPSGSGRGRGSITRDNIDSSEASIGEELSGDLASAATDSSNPDDQIATGGSGPTPGYAQATGGGVVNAGGAGGGGGSGGGGASGAKQGGNSYKAPARKGSSVANVYKRGGRGARRIASRKSKKNGKTGFENPFAKLKKKKTGGLNVKSSKEIKRALANEGVRSKKGHSLFKRVSRAHGKVYRKRNIIIYNKASL